VNYSREEDFIKNFGKNLSGMRKERKLSQEELAFKCELEYSQISRIERGVINTSISNVYKIAKALEIHPRDLFDF
jgi:transcriptional regulator with XRE-family HTH domain